MKPGDGATIGQYGNQQENFTHPAIGTFLFLEMQGQEHCAHKTGDNENGVEERESLMHGLGRGEYSNNSNNNNTTDDWGGRNHPNNK